MQRAGQRRRRRKESGPALHPPRVHRETISQLQISTAVRSLNLLQPLMIISAISVPHAMRMEALGEHSQ